MEMNTTITKGENINGKTVYFVAVNGTTIGTVSSYEGYSSRKPSGSRFATTTGNPTRWVAKGPVGSRWEQRNLTTRKAAVAALVTAFGSVGG